MKKVSIEEVDIVVNPMEVHSVRRPVSQALGTEHFAMNYFELNPGESFSGGLHTHHDQEEVFYIEEGSVTFRRPPGKENIVVAEGEAIRFEPGEFQTGVNESDNGETVVGWAFGAPGSRHDWNELESLVYCRRCEEETRHSTTLTEEGAFRLECNQCGNTWEIGG